MAERMVERRWESTGLFSRALRLALGPVAWGYGAIIRVRNAAYDRGILPSHALGLPTISVGNLTVGGTGKTPIAAWIAAAISEAGGLPAILLRGYGGDETLVHQLLAPRALVIASPNRRASAAEAKARGATAIVLDDAFQHRRVKRDADIVLISADRHRHVRLLPAGPWREPLESLRRATHIVVTRKRTTPLHAREVLGYATRMAPDAVPVIVHLAADWLVQWGTTNRKPVDALAGQDVLAVSAIGDPRAFEAQLRASSARITSRAFGDHYAFGLGDARRLAREAERAQYTVCTLKDAVKLGPLWPPSTPPLWYLSQRVSIELGAEALEGLARRLSKPANDR